MADPLLVGARFVQYVAASILFGLPAFRLYGLRGPLLRAERTVLALAAAALAAAALAALAAQAAAMTGAAAAAGDPAAWWDVATASQVGHALGARILLGLGLLGLVLAVAAPWRRLSLLGALGMASFAWSGHGAAGEGALGAAQLGADLAHLLAAGLWLGALAGLGIALLPAHARTADDRAALQGALEGFAGIGSALVAVLVATGLVNMWVLVTPARAAALAQTPYGLLLMAKLVLFGGMLCCAALNRFRLAPALRAAGPAALPALRRSLVVEAACGAAVLALVALFGILPPPAAM